MVLIVTPRMMLENGLAFIGYNVRDGVDAGTWDRRFRGHYGSDPLVYSKLFEDLQTTPIVEARIQEDKISLHYFLMTVYFLRHYPTELVVESVFKVSEKTARTWIWFYVAKIKELKRQKIVWPEQWNSTLILTVDGTHCPIEEPQHPTRSRDTSYFSHKFNRAAVSYELAISTYEPKLVWMNGPFPAATHDITIYRTALMNLIPDGKKIIGDEGYRGEPNTVSISNPNDTQETKRFKTRARCRHESFNRKIKIFNILSGCFRHSLGKHKSTFEAVCVIVQYQLENGSPLFDV